MCLIHRKGVSKELPLAQRKPGAFTRPYWCLQVLPTADKGLLVLQRLTGVFTRGTPGWHENGVITLLSG